MGSLKSLLGVIVAIAGVLYCGFMLYYFIDISGSVREAQDNGLGPTLLGLGAIVILVCIVLVVRLVRIFGKARTPRSAARVIPGVSTQDDTGGFDADAVLARYLAAKSAEAGAGSLAAPSANESRGPAQRPAFGRKVR